MNFREQTSETPEAATRFGVRANLYLGAVQLFVGAASGNIGFVTESVHQAADSVSLNAKANAMSRDSSPEKRYRLRKIAVKILLAGGLAGIAGGAHQLITDSYESSAPIEVGAAMIGAGVNTVIARRTHKSHHGQDTADTDDHTDNNSIGAIIDTKVHTLLDMGTGWVYACALAAENRYPGIASWAVGANGLASVSAGVLTMLNIKADNPACDHVH